MWLLALALDPDLALPHEDDRDTLRRMGEGDGQALGRLYDRHGRAAYSLALRILREQRDAEEVVQDVFVQAWRQSARYDTARGPVVAWVLMLTRSRAIDRLRMRRGLPALPGDAHEALRDLPDAGASADLLVVTAEQAAAVRAALDLLPHEQRAPIELAFYEGLTHVEVAARLEQPLGTIKTRIRLGLLRLRAAIEEAHP